MNRRSTLLLASIAVLAASSCRAPAPPPEPDQPSTEVAATHTPPPDYPLEQACSDIGGTVLMQVVVGPEGRATEVGILESSGVPELDRAAEAGVRAWEFRPATRRGQPVSQTIQVPMNFTPTPESELCLEREQRQVDQL
ncbi:energy transducer TonB [Marilutibacter chinensis]|uniref:Energy transducer TonB n=1 Tax=Marilutibacter chinensis TaxID=2912247 RepID=A0ABS9HNH2_9GAMM|nr:energy transducer TonB [Lysobacter chinensis]MCF7220536.1 energy transducer TonB [Lysobacter chinensis]